MGLFDEVRQARFLINKSDYSTNIKYRILAVMLSSVPAETKFGRGHENLDSRLDVVIKKNSNFLIGKYFHIKRPYGYSPEVHELLSPYTDFACLIGLQNWGQDFQYKITEMTHQIAREIEELALFPDEDLRDLKELGKKLLTDESIFV